MPVAFLYALFAVTIFENQLDLCIGKFKYAKPVWFVVTAPISGPMIIYIVITEWCQEQHIKNSIKKDI